MIAVAVVCALCAAAATQPRTQSRQKARYYYLEGVRHDAEGRNAEAYEYYRKAHAIDPGYEEAASAFGAKRLLINIDTLQSHTEVRRSLGMMRGLVDRYPGDIFESTLYAYVAAQTDTLGEAIRVFRRTAGLNPGKTALLVHLADTYMRAGQPDSALTALGTYERLEGKSPQLTMKKLGCLLAAKDTVGAIDEVNSLGAAYPDMAEIEVLKANLFEIIAMSDSVAEHYRRAEAMGPNGAVNMALAAWYQQQGDSVAYDNAIYDALMSEDFELDEKAQVLGEYLQTLLRDKSDTQRGDRLFEVLRRQNPHAPIVHDIAARYSAAKGDYATAIDEVGYAIALEPDEEVYRGQLMSYLLSDDKPGEAAEAYREALADIPEPSESLKLLYAGACSQSGQHRQARDIYAALIEEAAPGAYNANKIERPEILQSLTYDQLVRISTLYNLLGDSYYAEGEPERAFDSYENSLFFYDDNPLTLNNYAYFLTEEGGDLDKAAEMSRKALAQVPDNDTYLDTYAWIEFKLGHYDEARDYQQKAMDIAEANDVVSAELLEHYGDILFMCKEPGIAVEYWKRALELAPDNALLRKKVQHGTYFYPEPKHLETKK